jgi:hypothetical protein
VGILPTVFVGGIGGLVLVLRRALRAAWFSYFFSRFLPFGVEGGGLAFSVERRAGQLIVYLMKSLPRIYALSFAIGPDLGISLAALPRSS